MKTSLPPLALAAMIALAGCGESVPPTETVTADESTGGGDMAATDDAAMANADDMAATNMGNAAAEPGDAANRMAGANASMTAEGNAAMGAAKPVTIKKTVSYRCDDADKSVVKVDYMSDDLAAMIRMGTGAPVKVSTDKIGGPMAADDGTRLSVSGKEVVVKSADGKTMNCKG